MPDTVPGDLIPIKDAIRLSGRSRTWIEARVQTYRVGRIDMVSRAAVMAASQEYSTPKEKGRD